MIRDEILRLVPLPWNMAQREEDPDPETDTSERTSEPEDDWEPEPELPDIEPMEQLRDGSLHEPELNLSAGRDENDMEVDKPAIVLEGKNDEERHKNENDVKTYTDELTPFESSYEREIFDMFGVFFSNLSLI